MAGGAEPILWNILLIILGAKLGGEAAERIKQPAVLGELLVGVLLGASLLGGYLGLPDFSLEQEEESVLHDLEEADHEDAGAADGTDGGADGGVGVPPPPQETPPEDAAQRAGRFYQEHGAEVSALHILSALATIGVILLLFEVGLESDVKELTKVGGSSLLVALLGIVVSFGVGYGFSYGLAAYWDVWSSANDALPDYLLHIFVGATLTATSVGITARVLGDMGRLNSNETRIILGAAVLDDIGGLIILAIVAALVDAAIAGEAVNALGLAWIFVKAVGFLVVSLVLGLLFIPKLYDKAVDAFQVKGFPVALAIVFALLMAYLASVAGLADIVGAFAGGLILAQTKAAPKIFDDLRPIAAIFVSFFFVTLGMRVDLTQMGGNEVAVILIGVVLTILAMAAKLTCGFGVLKDAKASKLVVGVGMAPRGEVGLIFAALGLTTGLILNWQYTAIILVVMLTTFITPIWLKQLQDRFAGTPPGPGSERAEDLSQLYT